MPVAAVVVPLLLLEALKSSVPVCRSIVPVLSKGMPIVLVPVLVLLRNVPSLLRALLPPLPANPRSVRRSTRPLG